MNLVNSSAVGEQEAAVDNVVKGSLIVTAFASCCVIAKPICEPDFCILRIEF